MNMNLPDVIHQGQTIAQYRKAQKWSQEDLAEALQVDVRTVQRMEKQALIRDIKRRQLLVGLLGIPATLMALEDAVQTLPSIILHLNDDRMAFLEDQMAARWDLYYTGGSLKAARGLETWINEIARSSEENQGTSWHQRSLALLSLSYQLQSCILRDSMNYSQAHVAAQKAYQIAAELDDPELIASAIAREGLIFTQQEKPLDAIKYLTGALSKIHYLGLPTLKGYIIQGLSEAQAKAQQPQECWQSVGQLERILERREQPYEQNNTRLSIASAIAQKGINAVLLQDYHRALSLIDKSLVTYDPTMVRGRARLLAQKAEAYYGISYIDESVTIASEALTLAHSVGASKTLARIHKLHAILVQSPWRKERSVARLGAQLSL